MKILVLAALIAVVTSGKLSSQSEIENQTQWPWQVGKLYRYDVDSYTLARLPEGASTGTAFKAHFIIRVPLPGKLLARLENPTHALVHQELPSERQLPSDLKYQPLDKLEQPFEIAVEGGRVLTLNLPSTLPLAQENLLKGLVGALQLDLSTHRQVRKAYDGYEKESQQGVFKKMETDVTGDCETLYNVYPAVPEWRRELPEFAGVEEPIMISKTKNYGHCHHRVAYHFGVPDGAEWTGTAHKKHEEQFIRRATVTRMLAGKQGPIYKSETTSTVHVNPQFYGKDKAEVISYVQLFLTAFEDDSQAEWAMPENKRVVKNLLYAMSQKKEVNINDRSSSSESSESSESYENKLSKTINGVEMTSGNRVRRSAEIPKIVAINKVIVKRSEEDSSSSSSSDSTSAFENDDVPQENEPAYAALYMSPQSRTDKKQNPMNVQKLVQDMAQQLQNPNNMPKGDFLSKFNILVRVLASMSYEQLSLTSRSIEVTKLSNNLIKADMWMIYRDAMAQVGNMPAFQQIKAWIVNKKIQEEEAAEVVASLVQTIRYPTKEIMIQFFKLAVSDEVREQSYLNTTALIASTRLINMAQVNNETAHSFYPTHMYGRLARQHDSFVVEEVLPRLSKDLREAIERGDSSKAQVYIKAIGNLGHRSILDVFAPYLEGEIHVSTYLRTQMVQSFRVLAHQRDSYVRAVLYSILKNIAEPYEVRAAAIENIFMARPTSAMMQAMAQMTHNDPSIQIRALLKSSIVSAAGLKHPRNLDLARTAQTAKWMVTKQEYGKQYSSKFLNDYYDKEHELGYMSVFSYTGSEDSFWPKSFQYSFKTKASGWNKENTISASVSDVQQLMNVFRREIDRMVRKNPKSDSNHKYSADKVAEMLNIKRDPKNPLEASVLINFMGQERYFTYSEEELEQMPALISKYMSTVVKGSEKHYTKVLNQAQVSIMFPVSMGMPFIYKYKEPMVIHAQSKVNGQINPSENENIANIDKELYFTFARNIDGDVGFMDTLANQYAKVGVVSKFQLHLPLKMQLQAKSGELKITMESLRPDQDNTLVHYSVWPYSTNQKKDTLVTVSQDTNTKVINRNKKIISIDSRLGQAIGQQYQIQGYSYSTDYKNFGNMINSQDLFTNIVHLVYQRDVALTHFNFKHLAKQSRNKRVVLTVAYDKITFSAENEKLQSKDQLLTASHMEDVSPNSKNRRYEMATRVSSGIKKATVRIIDVSTIFEGQQNQQFVMTAAIGDSPVDSKIQYAFFAGKNSEGSKTEDQINSVGTVYKPEATPLNFLEAIQKEKKMKFTFDVKYGQSGKGNVHVDGFMERSKRYTEELLNQPWAKLCTQQIEKDNLYQYACHKMLIRAHALDYLKASVAYKEVSPSFRNMTYKAFSIVNHLGFWYTDVNPLKTTPDGKLEIESQWWYPENTMALALYTRLGEVRFSDVPMPKGFDSWLSIYTPFKPEERVLNQFTRDQYQPFCTVDSSKIRTFSNRSYDYTLTRSWHVVMQEDTTYQGGMDKLVVLARRPQNKPLELYISYKTRSGKDLEVEVQPNPEGPNRRPILKVNTDAKKVSEEDLVMYYDELNKNIVLEYYTLSDGVLIIDIQEGRLRLAYDGSRLVALAREHRNRINGICGRMSGDKRDDYLTPTGLVDRPEHFGASFALKEADSDPKTLELQAQAQQVSYPTKHQYTVILPRDPEWREWEQSADSTSSINVFKTRSWRQKRGQCQVQNQVQFYQTHSEICITLTPLPSCESHCRGDGYKIQAAQVVCRPLFDQEFRAYRDQIRQGHNPRISEVPEQRPRQFKVPIACRV